MTDNIKILSIETSCDETAAAVIGIDKENNPVLLSNIVSSQIDLHAKTGGIVPEVASRAHMEAIVPVITQALLGAQYQADKTDNCELTTENYNEAIKLLGNITHIAITAGPGLIGSLLVGFNAAKTLAFANNLPIIPINHIEGHIYSAMLSKIQNSKFKIQNDSSHSVAGLDDNELEFPVLTLTVSGGHSSLNLMTDHGKYETIGQTIDDAAGEAFDKVAQLLDLGYPGGPIVSKLASEYRNNSKSNVNCKLKIENSTRGIIFPRPILNDGTLNFSFSGLKTAVLVHVKKMIADGHQLSGDEKAEICAAFEDAVVDVLTTKTIRAAEKYQPKTIILAGGVAANDFLRKSMQEKVEGMGIQFIVPPKKFCGDNAAMIGMAAFYHVQRGDIKNWDQIEINSNARL